MLKIFIPYKKTTDITEIRHLKQSWIEKQDSIIKHQWILKYY